MMVRYLTVTILSKLAEHDGKILNCDNTHQTIQTTLLSEHDGNLPEFLILSKLAEHDGKIFNCYNTQQTSRT